MQCPYPTQPNPDGWLAYMWDNMELSFAQKYGRNLQPDLPDTWCNFLTDISTHRKEYKTFFACPIMKIRIETLLIMHREPRTSHLTIKSIQTRGCATGNKLMWSVMHVLCKFGGYDTITIEHCGIGSQLLVKSMNACFEGFVLFKADPSVTNHINYDISKENMAKYVEQFESDDFFTTKLQGIGYTRNTDAVTKDVMPYIIPHYTRFQSHTIRDLEKQWFATLQHLVLDEHKVPQYQKDVVDKLDKYMTELETACLAQGLLHFVENNVADDTNSQAYADQIESKWDDVNTFNQTVAFLSEPLQATDTSNEWLTLLCDMYTNKDYPGIAERYTALSQEWTECPARTVTELLWEYQHPPLNKEGNELKTDQNGGLFTRIDEVMSQGTAESKKRRVGPERYASDLTIILPPQTPEQQLVVLLKHFGDKWDPITNSVWRPSHQRMRNSQNAEEALERMSSQCKTLPPVVLRAIEEFRKCLALRGSRGNICS